MLIYKVNIICYILFKNLKEAMINARISGCNSLTVCICIIARYPGIFLDLLKNFGCRLFVLISTTGINVLCGLRQSGIGGIAPCNLNLA